MNLSDIKLNESNPRFIKDDRFIKLVNSIRDFPKMLELRPIITDDSGMILGGNMRYRALKELKYKEIPDNWVKKASELTEEEKKRFIIEDNIGFGEWDWDILVNEWGQKKLEEWGMELLENNNIKKEVQEIEPYIKSHILISYSPEFHDQVNDAIIELLNNDNIEIERSAN